VDPDGSGCEAAPKCNGVDETQLSCEPLFEANGTPCTDDGLFCTGPETCEQFTCQSSGDPCLPLPGSDANCAQSCDEAADSCTATDPDGSLCDDGLLCAGDSCQGGACIQAENQNPACSPGTFLGSVSGDTPSADLGPHVGANEQWLSFRLTEDDLNLDQDPTAMISLHNSAGSNFDLCVYCPNCADPSGSCSFNPAGQIDTVYVRKNDNAALDDDFDVIIQVYYTSSLSCGGWGLFVSGGWPTPDVNCP
jgi:hypothetical protein